MTTTLMKINMAVYQIDSGLLTLVALFSNCVLANIMDLYKFRAFVYKGKQERKDKLLKKKRSAHCFHLSEFSGYDFCFKGNFKYGYLSLISFILLQKVSLISCLTQRIEKNGDQKKLWSRNGSN